MTFSTSDDSGRKLEEYIDEITYILQASKDVSQLEFQCLVEEAFGVDDKIIKNDSNLIHHDYPVKKRKIPWKLIIFVGLIFSYGVIPYESLAYKSYTSVAPTLGLPYSGDLFYLFYLGPLRAVAVTLGLPSAVEVPQCLIPNPFAMTEDVGSNEQPQSDDCTCWNITHILSIKAGTDIPIMNPDLVGENLNPIVLKQFSQHSNPDKLRDILSRRGPLLSEVPNFVSSNWEDVMNMSAFSDLQKFDIVTLDAYTHVEWLSNHYMGAGALRELLPLPTVLALTYFEEARAFMFDGARADAYELPAGLTVTLAYIQGWGSRRLILTPREPCMARCRFLSTRMDVGDVLLFSMGQWAVRSEAVEQAIDSKGAQPSLSMLVSLHQGGDDITN